MYNVYILESLVKKRYYIGHTGDIIRRMSEHNAGRNRSSKAYIPWKVVYTEEYPTKQEAYRREMQIKSYKGGRAFRDLLA
jgi:putative endonuclease